MTQIDPASLPQSSRFLDVAPGVRVHLRHIPGAGPAVLMLHGAIANARTFYSERGKGLGPWLAAQGLDVYMLDMRGRGLSEPPIRAGDTHGQFETLCVDLPAAMAEITRLRGGIPVYLVGHSWGGVLLTAFLARHPAWASRVAASIYLGSKRAIRVWNWARLIEIELVWHRLAKWVAWRRGYLPANRLRLGADNETRRSLQQSQQWVRAHTWIDDTDGFDYHRALNDQRLPPTLYLAGGNDPVRGHEADVRRFAQESGEHDREIRLLARKAGLSRDYDHIDMLTHPQAEQEVYPQVLDWIKQHGIAYPQPADI
ncbi:alpha/beta fold hydrolase [Chitinimonas sp. BJYL2]|uniref:alpha/beta fold hydrolase n=1 Tax=Chitinimonas sp. BJYL2 TaxID=2976696 RepID=UPI0022B2E81F|nr:alpha/beta fold hydrolase [Chitinimonas sp. BJYL2]